MLMPTYFLVHWLKSRVTSLHLFLFSRSKTTWDIILINSNKCSHHQQRPLPPLSEGEELASWIERDRRDLRSLVHHRHLHSAHKRQSTKKHFLKPGLVVRHFQSFRLWHERRHILLGKATSAPRWSGFLPKDCLVICFSMKSRKKSLGTVLQGIAMFSCMNRGMYSLCVMILIRIVIFQKNVCFISWFFPFCITWNPVVTSPHNEMQERLHCDNKTCRNASKPPSPLLSPRRERRGRWQCLEASSRPPPSPYHSYPALETKIRHGSGFFLSQYVESLIA